MNTYWLIIALIIGGILTYLNNRKKFFGTFYKHLNNTQLKEEAVKFLNEITNSFDENSNFIYTKYKDIHHLKSEVEKLIKNIEQSSIEDLQHTTSLNTHDFLFMELAKINNWPKSKLKLIEDLDLIFIEISIRQGLLPRDYH